MNEAMTKLAKLQAEAKALQSAKKPEAPRQYAELILKLPTREARRDYLDKCPKHLQDLIRKHVENHFERVKYANQKT